MQKVNLVFLLVIMKHGIYFLKINLVVVWFRGSFQMTPMFWNQLPTEIMETELCDSHKIIFKTT